MQKIFTGLTKIREALDVVSEIDILYAIRFCELQPNEPVSYESVLAEIQHSFHNVLTVKITLRFYSTL